MPVQPNELDALIAEARDLAATAADELAHGPAAGIAGAADAAATVPPDLARVLNLRVPLIVQLARRKLGIAFIRGLSTGAIIEFEKSVEEGLELLINNRCIGRGICVKVGENFGLKLRQIGDTSERIQSLGA